MTKSENFPIFRAALEMSVYVETIVKGFDRYHKYTIGKDMRKFSKDMLFIINRVGLSRDKARVVRRLRDRCEDMKMLILISKELQAFKSFKQFEYLSHLSVSVCKQAQAWLGSMARVTR